MMSWPHLLRKQNKQGIVLLVYSIDLFTVIFHVQLPFIVPLNIGERLVSNWQYSGNDAYSLYQLADSLSFFLAINSRSSVNLAPN